MKLEEAKQQFINSWGAFGTQWGINRTMAQIHALLLSVENPLTTDEIMEQLQISRSNANLNIRALLDWELILFCYSFFKPAGWNFPSIRSPIRKAQS